ncbi:MAG: MerR family transcriptional regulator [Gammaproteobacteria bacterium]
MSKRSKPVELPPIPSKRYFTIGEVGELCQLKPHVLRYWEQEFRELSPVKRRGNRRYYRFEDVQLIRRIRELLYEQGFTLNGARAKLNKTVKQKSLISSESIIKTTIQELESVLELLR